jgi:hypothetical protein
MNRIDFIKRLALATVAIAAIPVIPDAVKALLPKPEAGAQVFAIYFKVSREILQEAETVGHFFQMAKDLKKVPPDYSLISYEVGFDGDDFVKDLQTVVLKFRKV